MFCKSLISKAIFFVYICALTLINGVCFGLEPANSTEQAGVALQTQIAANPNNAGAELIQLLGNTTTMQADFVQFLVNRAGAEEGKSTYGKMSLERPGKFRWETRSPGKQLLIANNQTVWVYDADLEQATKRKIDYHQPGNPALLLSGTTDTLQKTFKITKLNMPGVGEWFELQPKSTNNIYQWIKVHFVDGKIVAMLIADNLGQQSEILFENISLNQPLANALFNFTPPRGTDVVGE